MLNENVLTKNPEIEDSLPQHWRPWFMWFSASGFGLFQFFLQLSSGVMLGDLMTDFHLSPFGASALIATYYYIYVFFQTPAGLLIDRYGVRKLLSLTALICASGCFLFANAQTLPQAVLGRLIMGGGAAFAFIGALHIIRENFNTRYFPLMLGLTESAGMFLTVLGTINFAYFIHHLGWRLCMTINGFVLIFIGSACFYCIRDNNKTSAIPEENGFSLRLKAVLGDARLWLNGLYSGLMFSIATVFAAVWGIPFVIEATSCSLTLATSASTMVFIGVACGGPLMGYLVHKTESMRPLLIFGAIANLALFGFIILKPMLPLPAYFVLFYLMGVSSSTYILNFPIAANLAPDFAKSTSSGFTNALCVSSAPLFQPLIGYALVKAAHIHGHDHFASYAISDYQLAFLIMPLLMIIALFIAIYLPEKN